MSSEGLQIPESARDQEEALFRMYNGPRPLIYGESRTYPLHFIRSVHDLTIVEEYSPVSPPNPLAAPLAAHRAAYRVLQYNVFRGLWIAFAFAVFAALRAILHSHDWWLIFPLWMLATACIPLLILLSQQLTGGR